MDLPVKLEDIVKSLAEKALEQENAAKQRTAHEGGVPDGEEDSDEHEFDTEQLEQMLEEEKSKKRQTRRARAGGAPPVSRGANKRKLENTTGNNKRVCSSVFDSSAEAGSAASIDLHADNHNSRRPSRKTSKGGESDADAVTLPELKPTKIESVENKNLGQFADDKNLSALVKTEFQEAVGDIEKRTEFAPITKSIVKHKRSRIDKAHQDLIKIGCDCYLSPEDIKGGAVACCDDSCSNRAVCIECPPKCRLGQACCNQRMQRGQYAPLQVHYAGKKGYGLYATRPVPKGDLIIEYVGEIVSSRQFTKRAKQYEKSGIRHHYFMSLNNDEVIDATRKGNEGRFINHCCDPNCETQKWIVGGETRIGFFARRDIAADEEFSIDYQFVRFGSQSATRCLCGARNCRGFIGVESSAHATSTAARGGKTQFEIELSKLVDVGAVKNSAGALKYAHVFIHATKDDDILTLVRVLQNSEQYTDGLKAFLRLHGLNILHCYMTQLKFSKKPLPLMNELMAVLQALVDSNAITSRNGLEDSGIMRELDEWAGLRPPQMPVTTVAAPTPAAESKPIVPRERSAKAVSPQKPESVPVADNNNASSQVNASALIESTLEELKRDEAEQERARIDKVFSKICTQVAQLDMARNTETFETGMIDCCKASTAEERRQHAQVMVLKHTSLTVTSNNAKLDKTDDAGGVKTNSAVGVKIEENAVEDDATVMPSRRGSAGPTCATPNPSADIVMDPMGYSSSSDEDDSDDEDDDDDHDGAGEATETDELLTMLDNEQQNAAASSSATPANVAGSSLSNKATNSAGGKFAKHNNSTLTPTTRVKQTPYMRLLTFLNHLERQARAVAEQEQRQQRRLARKAEIAAKKEEAAPADSSHNLSDISISSSNMENDDDVDDSMDVVGTDEEDAASIAFRENSLGLPSPQKMHALPQQSAAALLEHADEQFQRDIAETQRLRRYTLEFIDYCKQNLHIVFKIQKRNSALTHTQITAAAAAKSKEATKKVRTLPAAAKMVKAEKTDVQLENNNNNYRNWQNKQPNTFSPPQSMASATTPQQMLPQTSPPVNIAVVAAPPAPPTPQAVYEQHKKLMADFVPVLYADEEKRRIEREKQQPTTAADQQQLSAAERTAQMFEKQVEKQDMFDAWMMAVKASAARTTTNGGAGAQSKEAQYVTQHRSQVLQTVMNYMNGTRKQPEKWRVKQEVRQQKQRILTQPNYFMHVPAPHSHHAAAGPRPNQELKASIYSRIQTDICACVAEKVSQQFGQLLHDAKGEELQKRLYVMLPTGERVLLSDNKCTFENQRKYRSLMPLKHGSNDWNLRLLQLKRFRLVREFLDRQSATNSTAKDNKQSDDSNKLSNIPPLCNPTTAGYTSNFDHAFYCADNKDNDDAADFDTSADHASVNDAAGFRVPLPHGINVAFNQQGPKGLLYCWDEETLQSSWLMPSAHLEESIDDFVRAAVPVTDAPPPTKTDVATGSRGTIGTGGGIRLPHEATFTRFVWKDGFKTALPQNYESEWLDLLQQDAVALGDIDSQIAAAAAATANATSQRERQQPSSTSQAAMPSSSTAAVTSSLAEYQAAAASTLLRRNRHAAAAANVATSDANMPSPSTATMGNSGENGSSSGNAGESRCRRESGAASGGGGSTAAANATETSTVFLTKAEFRDRVSRHVVNALNPYRKPTCQKGRIRNKDDFKVVARELTHKIVDAELKRHSEQQLRSNTTRCFVYSSKLETKIDTFVAKYMQRYGKVYDPSVPVPSSSSILPLSAGARKKNRPSTSSHQQKFNHSFDDEDEMAEPPSVNDNQALIADADAKEGGSEQQNEDEKMVDAEYIVKDVSRDDELQRRAAVFGEADKLVEARPGADVSPFSTAAIRSSNPLPFSAIVTDRGQELFEKTEEDVELGGAKERKTTPGVIIDEDA